MDRSSRRRNGSYCRMIRSIAIDSIVHTTIVGELISQHIGNYIEWLPIASWFFFLTSSLCGWCDGVQYVLVALVSNVSPKNAFFKYSTPSDRLLAIYFMVDMEFYVARPDQGTIQCIAFADILDLLADERRFHEGGYTSVNLWSCDFIEKKFYTLGKVWYNACLCFITTNLVRDLLCEIRHPMLE